MKVALDVAPLHGQRTGIGTAVEQLEHRLRGHPAIEVRQYVVSYRAMLSPGVTRLPLPARVATRLWARTNRPRVDRWIGQVDLIHGTNYVVPPARTARLVSVYDCWFLEQPEKCIPDVRRAGSILRRSIASGAWVHTSSTATEKKVRELCETDRVRTIHLGLPALERCPDAPPPEAAEFAGQRFVLALGTCEYRKRQSWLAGMIAEMDPTIDFVIAGSDGDDSATLHALISGLSQAHRRRIHLLGAISGETKSWLLHNAAALAYPSLDEGFGFPILEAQLAGVPVVASDVGSIAEVGGAGVRLVARDDRAGFVQALHECVEPGDSRTSLVAAGTSNIGRFSWDRTVDELVTYYLDIVGGCE